MLRQPRVCFNQANRVFLQSCTTSSGCLAVFKASSSSDSKSYTSLSSSLSKGNTGQKICHRCLPLLLKGCSVNLIKRRQSQRNNLETYSHSIGNVCSVSESSSRRFSTHSVLYREHPGSSITASETFTQEQSLPTPAQNLTSSIDGNDSLSDLLLYPDFPLIEASESGFFLLHQSGLAWWSCIMLVAVTVRGLLMLPLNIYVQHNMLRLERLMPELKERFEKLRTEIGVSMYKHSWTQDYARQEFSQRRREILKELHIRDNCHPMKNTAVFWAQMPIWVSVSFALRNMSRRADSPDLAGHSQFSDMTSGGLAWFSDLTVVDASWTLPLMMGLVTLFNVEWNYLKLKEVTQYRKYLTYFLRGLSLVFIPVCASMPSAMVVYWVTSAYTATSLNLLLETAAFQALVRLPPVPPQTASLAQRARQRYFRS